MTVKDMAAFVVTGILTVALPIGAGGGIAEAAELAGADEEDKATKDQLREAGQGQMPAKNLKKAVPKSEPSVQPVSQKAPVKAEPEKKMAEPEKKMAEPEKKMAEPERKPAPEPVKAAEPSKPEQKTAPESPQIAAPYLRMDVGYGLTMNPSGRTTAGDMTGEDVGNLALFGGGIGYRFSDSIRADLTVSYRPDTDVDATTAGDAAVASEVDGMTVMLNGYYDLPDFEGFTPYVGAGIGMARLETADQTGTVTGGATSTNLAWAMMLGTSIDVGLGESTVGDLGYRFISLGEFAQQDGTTYDDLYVHEFRAGLRHQF